MSKLVYPNDGIYKHCRNDIDNIKANLSKAISTCSFDIPSSFTYISYLRGLSSTLNRYYREIENIEYKLQQSDSNYETLESNLDEDAKKMIATKIKDRDRMIV